MKVIEYIKVAMVTAIIVGLFLLICTMMIAHNIYPDGQTDNPIIKQLLEYVTIQTVMADDKWVEEYPFEQSALDAYKRKVYEIEKSIESYCTTSFPASGRIEKYVAFLKSEIYHYEIDDIPGIYRSIEYVKEPANNVIEFSKELSNKGYPFLYVATPAPQTIEYYSDEEIVGEGEALMIPERSYALTSILEENGVQIINIPRDYGDNIKFDSSDHWFPEDGLWCAALIAEKLNENYGFEFDLNSFSIGNFDDYLKNYPEIAKEIIDYCGYEFCIPIPNNKANYKMIYAEDSIWEGNFAEVFLSDTSEWTTEGGPYHSIFRVKNASIYEIYNRTTNTNCGKKILVIGDSFNWAVSTYLAIGVENVTIIHNAGFSGSIMNYIEKMKPDVVLIVYNDAEFYEIFTKDAYDLK